VERTGVCAKRPTFERQAQKGKTRSAEKPGKKQGHVGLKQSDRCRSFCTKAQPTTFQRRWERAVCAKKRAIPNYLSQKVKKLAAEGIIPLFSWPEGGGDLTINNA